MSCYLILVHLIGCKTVIPFRRSSWDSFVRHLSPGYFVLKHRKAGLSQTTSIVFTGPAAVVWAKKFLTF